MNLTELADLGEFLGGFAVVVTLVYLAFQVRQNTRTIRAQSQLESARFWSEQNRAGALHPSMLRILEEGFADASRLDDDEQRQFLWWIAHHIFMAEGFFHSFRAGLLSEESWKAHERVVAGILRCDAGRRWWRSGVTPLSESFHAHLEGLIDSTDGESWDYPRIRDIFETPGS